MQYVVFSMPLGPLSGSKRPAKLKHMQTLIKDIAGSVSQKVTLKGWLYNKRSSGKITFLELRDGTGFMQGIVVKDAIPQKVWQAAERATQESSVIAEGVVSQHPRRPDEFELQISNLEVVQLTEEFPLGKKDHGPEFLLDNRHLWLRSKKQWAIERVRDKVITAIYKFFHDRGFIKIDTPIITPNACEGATTLFELEYFDQGKVFLSQSGQLYLEAAVMAVGRAFDFGPTFRAEKSKTKRHLIEFWMMDAEAAYMDHAENLKTQEDLITFIIEDALAHCAKELQILERNIEPLKRIKPPFTRLTYTEAIKQLNQLGSDIKFGEDLGNDDEVLLTKDSAVPVFIERWPKSIKPFYMKPDPENPELVLNDDLIGIEGAGELIGGSQREDDYTQLKAAITAAGLKGPEYEWYLDLRKYGSVPHSGFGLGLERTVKWICGVEHVRETIPFPRLLNRVRP